MVTGPGHVMVGGRFAITFTVVEQASVWPARSVTRNAKVWGPAWAAVGVQLKVLLTGAGALLIGSAGAKTAPATGGLVSARSSRSPWSGSSPVTVKPNGVPATTVVG